jgi:magnesium transporter
VLRAAEWTDSLRDLVNSILETNLTIQGNRLNVITKKVTSWAAIIAVPTFITGLPIPRHALRGQLLSRITEFSAATGLLWWYRRSVRPASRSARYFRESGAGNGWG